MQNEVCAVRDEVLRLSIVCWADWQDAEKRPKINIQVLKNSIKKVSFLMHFKHKNFQ